MDDEYDGSLLLLEPMTTSSMMPHLLRRRRNATESLLMELNATDNASCTESLGLSRAKVDDMLWVVDVCMAIACLCSAPLQIYVMRKAVGHIRRRTGDQCLHIFLLSMTFGDFLLTGFCYPVELLPSVFQRDFDIIINSLMHNVTWIALMTSSLSLVLLNVDKLLFFKYPLRYSAYINRSRALTIIAVLWAGCGVFVVSIWLYGCFKCLGDQCQRVAMFSDSKGLYLGFTFFVSILPILSSLLVACYVMSVVTKHKKQLAEEQALCRSSNASSNSQHVKGRLKTFYFIFMSSVVTAVTLLPNRVYNSNTILNQIIMEMNGVPDNAPKFTCPVFLLRYGILYLLQCNGILNPLLTVTILPQYRINCNRLCWWKTKPRVDDSMTMRTRLATDL